MFPVVGNPTIALPIDEEPFREEVQPRERFEDVDRLLPDVRFRTIVLPIDEEPLREEPDP